MTPSPDKGQHVKRMVEKGKSVKFIKFGCLPNLHAQMNKRLMCIKFKKRFQKHHQKHAVAVSQALGFKRWGVSRSLGNLH